MTDVDVQGHRLKSTHRYDGPSFDAGRGSFDYEQPSVVGGKNCSPASLAPDVRRTLIPERIGGVEPGERTPKAEKGALFSNVRHLARMKLVKSIELVAGFAGFLAL
jgi:hypothetical protein